MATSSGWRLWFVRACFVLVLALGMALLLTPLRGFAQGTVPDGFSSKVYRGKDDRGGDMVLRLLDSACEDPPTLTLLVKIGAGHMLAEAKAVQLAYWGRDWKACWLDVGEAALVLIGEDESHFRPIPLSLFKNEAM